MKGLKKRRLELKLTLRELSVKCGLSIQSLSNYETGQRFPNAAKLKKIAQALDCSVDDLLKE